MKMLGLLLLVCSLSFIGCGRGGDNTGTNVAAVPQSCGANGISPQYCMPYSAGMASPYGGMPGYGGTPYGGYGFGANQPYYGAGAPYGCPYGYQPLYTGGVWNGSGFTCVSVNSLGYGNPYYPSNFTWGASGYVGTGPLQACDSYIPSSCGYFGGYCMPAFGQRFGYCVR